MIVGVSMTPSSPLALVTPSNMPSTTMNATAIVTRDQMAPFLFGQADDPQHADDITKGAVKDHTQNAIQMRNQWVQASLLLMVDYAMQM